MNVATDSTPSTPIRVVAIIGAGTMGWQIALQCARRGVEARLLDRSPTALDAALARIAEKLAEWVEAEVLTRAEADAIRARVRPASELAAAVATAQVAIEAIVEAVEPKRALLRELDTLCAPETILATNSSSIRSRLLAGATTRPDRVLNLHFLRRPWDRPILEIMSCGETSISTFELGVAFARQIGLVPIRVRREATGYVFNRLWRAVKKEALWLAREGIAPVEDIDRAFILGFGTAAGPFMLMDQVGLDVTRDIERQWFAESGDDRDRPPPYLEEWVAEGRLGVKSGRGFYRYPHPPFERSTWLMDGENDPDAGP